MSGLDQEMPGNFTPDVGPGTCNFCGPLLDAVRNGQVPESRIDDAVLRILREMLQHHLFDQPPVIQPLPVQQDGAVARDIAEKGMVLLKNDADTLPLKGVTSIAVIGSDADRPALGSHRHERRTYRARQKPASRSLRSCRR